MKPLDIRILDLFESLTPSEQRLANVVLEHQRDLAGYSATELAALAQVSKATAARLFKRLGYDGFDQARRQARSVRHWGSPLHALDYFVETERLDANPVIHVQADLANLSRTFEHLRPEALWQAVDALAEAERVWLIGFRGSYPLAFFARFWLALLKPDVRVLPAGGFSFAEDVIDISPSHVVLAIGFRRRPAILKALLEKARDAGAKIILITDLSASLTSRYADVVLRCHSRAPYLFDSYTAAISLMNYLAAALAQRLGEAGRARLRRIDELHDDLDRFSAPPRSI